MELSQNQVEWLLKSFPEFKTFEFQGTTFKVIENTGLSLTIVPVATTIICRVEEDIESGEEKEDFFPKQ